MENEEKKIITIGGKDHSDLDLDQVPEPFRALLKARLDAARDGKPAPGGSKITIPKDFKFNFNLQDGPGMGMISFLKLLVQASQANRPVEPGQAAPPPAADRQGVRPEARPEFRPQAQSDTFQSGAVTPTSSGWVIWLALLILAAFYLFFSGKGQQWLAH